MGIVYEVLDRQSGERVALKTILNFDAAALYKFKQEFRTLADVLHPNLVHLYELVAGEQDQVFFTMELVEGTDFLGYVHKPGTARAGLEQGQGPRSSPAEFERLRPALRQLVEGVLALHNAGRLHRDLKPSNVRVTPEGRVVILDFGVATELRRRAGNGEDDEVVGTVAYMAPEQGSGDTPNAASDWYSVGAMLYEAMTGEPPFTGSSVEVLTLKNTIAPLPPSARVPGVPADLDALCVALLDAEPGQRPSGAEILSRLGANVSEHPSGAPMADAEVTYLVGREQQVQALHEAFEATRAGRSIAVRVPGLTGLGKSAVVHHFLDELERRGHVLVLRGRAYERESVPYKAVDAVIDALSRHLMALHERGDPLALPGDIAALAHVFPVLRRIHGIDEIPQASVGDPQLVRQRAFAGLRELFSLLAQRQPVVIFVDDVHWGDNDSAALLLELMRPPGEPSLLFLTTHRTEEAGTSAFLASVRDRWPEDAEVREVSVGPLEFEDAKRLALHLIGAGDAQAPLLAETVARESGGSPFLVEELARSASAHHRVMEGGLSTAGSLMLDQILAERAARLPKEARRLLEVVAVGGRPLPVSTVGAASNTGDAAAQMVALLRARRFVRAGLRNGLEVVEAIHDRIRDTIVAHLPAETVRKHHARLAGVLEATPDSDPEAIAVHLLGAGNKERAAHYAERAAEQAIAKLAFAQAARLYQLTIETLSSSAPEARRLYRRLGEASEWAGLGERAARAYLSAAEVAPLLERVDLERAAAAQLVAAGRIDEGAAVFRRVLAAVGRPVPRSIFGIIVGVIMYRFAAQLMGRKLRAPRWLPFEVEVRLNALSAATRGLTVVDPISSMYVKARYLVDALRSGHRSHIVHAAAAEASTLSSRGGKESKRERMLFDIARRIAEESGDSEGLSLYQIVRGISHYVRGCWKPALDLLDPARAKLAAERRWNANASVYAVYALTNLGNLREVKSRTTRLIADAEQRGDLYTAVNLRASHPMAAWLGANDVDGARRHLRESMAEWSKTRFLVQHWQAMLWETEVELYSGDGTRAWERLDRDARRLRRSRLLTVQLLRVLTHYVRGRAAIASLPALPERERAARLAEADRAAQRLERESMPWTAPLAALLMGSVAQARGQISKADQFLRRAIELASAAEMPLHAAAARHQLGSMLGGDPGETIRTEAEDAFRSCGVRVPAAYAQMLVPGRWRSGAT
jgi:hypothetical protein